MKHLWKTTILVFLISFAYAGETHAEKPPLDIYGNLPFVASAAISPDGEHVAILANIKGQSRLVIYDADLKPLEAFETSKLKARHIAFLDNDHVILWVSRTDRVAGFYGKFEASYAYAINFKTGKRPVQLLNYVDNLHPAQSGLGTIVGRGRKPNHVSMTAFVGPIEKPLYSLIEVSLKTGRGKVSAYGLPDTSDWYVNETGLPLALELFDNRKKRFSLRRKIDGGTEEFYYFDEEEIPIAIYGVMPDESGLAYAITYSNGEALMKAGFDGKKSGPIFKVKDGEIELVIVDRNRKVLGIQISGEVPTYKFLDVELDQATKWMNEQLPGASLYLMSWTDDRSKLLYRVFDANLGDAWLVQHRSENKIRLLTLNRLDLKPEMIANVYSIAYKARDGTTIPAILTIPPGEELDGNSDRPLVVFPHGGPSAHDSMDFDWMAQFFASRGYVVLQPNFRGSTGYGRDFQELGKGEWGLKMQDDLTDGVAKMVEADIAGASDVCIVGASYGGYAALAGGAFTPDLYKCVIAIAPVSDLPRMMSDEKQDYGKDHWVVSYWENLIADGDGRRERLKKVSPIFFAKDFKAPVLLLHGNDDTVVPFVQSRVMARALKNAKKEVTLVKLKGEDHWLSTPKMRLQTLREIEKFLEKHMPVRH